MVGKRNAAEDMNKMQEEAIRRIKEIHARSKPDNVPAQRMNASSAREKTPKGNNNMPKKENIPKKPHPTQKRNPGFNFRRTKLIKNIFSNGNTGSKPHPENECSSGLFGNLPSFIDLIFKDSDKSLLIVLIILLMDDEENFMILLVLFYLLI